MTDGTNLVVAMDNTAMPSLLMGGTASIPLANVFGPLVDQKDLTIFRVIKGRRYSNQLFLSHSVLRGERRYRGGAIVVKTRGRARADRVCLKSFLSSNDLVPMLILDNFLPGLSQQRLRLQ